MSDETPGAGQSALPPREDTTSRQALRVAQVQGGQFILSSQPHTVPALTQITNGNVATNATLTPGGVTRIISLSPVRNQTSPLRPSLTNQTIVSALTKSRTNSNIRLQLFPGGDISPQGITTTKSPVKRSLPLNSEKDSYSSKLQRVMNHRNVRSKIVKEKFNEHLLECYYLEIGGNILDLYQFAKRPKTQQFLAYIKENAIDPKDHSEEVANLQSVIPVTTPSATCVTSLPGISHSMLSTTVQNAQISTTQCASTYTVTNPRSSNGNKMKISVGYPTGINQEQIVEKAKQEAYVVQRISDLQKEGLWSERRLPKIQEMPRAKAHWDFLLEEMVWLAADFAQERKWKKAAAKKCARMVQKYFQDKALAAQRAEKAQEQHIRRIAAFCAKEIKTFWSNVEKLVEYKQNTRLEEKRKKALDQHLSFIVDQTEKYSQLLAEGMNKQGCVEGANKPNLTIGEQTVPNSNVSSRPDSRAELSDDDFHPSSVSTSSDDEDTIALEEEISKEEQDEEVAALQRESEMDLDTFLREVVPKDYLVNRNILIQQELQESEMSDSDPENDDDNGPPKLAGGIVTKDDDFIVNSSDEDDEETIQEQEQEEGAQDHQQEIDELKAENELSVEELRKKYSSLPSIPDDEINVLSENSNSSDEEIEYSSTESSESDSESTYSHLFRDQKNEEFDLEFILDNSTEFQNGEEKKTDNNDLINDAAAIAESIQPKGNTLSSTSVVTPVPFLLKLPLREYQHIGLDWLVTMFERKLNGILADEMGLGKTIQTIALLSHLACEKENWGPHLIIVPTSVMLNWEMECKKWCPAFKILTYYGTQKERKLKRTGWTKPNAFHICITSYKLVIQDHQSFRRKKWKYLILDEAQNIKNFKSQRWQLLLNFQTQQRLLLTGTPLQNNLMELWSLMHFLMPHVFQSHREFKEWFSNPVAGMIEGNSEYNESIIKRLHKVLRPFLLRRLKSEVEKQMPKKYEHIIMCRLSKRQRYLYDDYMSRAKTRETLASGNLLSVINVLMQLRKVCNHPNLFEVRPTISPFHCEGIIQHIPSLIYEVFEYNPFTQVNFLSLNLCLLEMELYLSAYQCYRMRQYETPRKLIEEMYSEKFNPPDCPPARLSMYVRKVENTKEAKVEVKEETNSKPNQVLQNASSVKLKVGPGVQLIQQGIPVPHVSIGSQSSGPNINLSSVLKPSEKITVPAGFAQLVQTSTGKHILFTPSSCISTSNLAVGSATVMTSTGQRLTVLSQSVVANSSNPQQTLAKAVVKVQLTSVPSATTSTISTTSSEIKAEDRTSLQTRTVSSKYIEKLYANQSSKRDLDVRWMNKNEEEKYCNDENMETMDSKKNKAALIYRVNSKRCSAVPLYGQDFRNAVKVSTPTKSHWINGRLYCLNVNSSRNVDNISDCLRNLVFQPDDIMEQMKDTFNRFIVYVPAVHAPEVELQVWHPSPSIYWGRKLIRQKLINDFSKPTTLLHPIVSAMITQFPHPRLIQYDCGKLQTLDKLLRKLKTEGHRVLIFTQMTKMLDVLEAFLNFHGHIYLRLDGTTKVDQRQILMERFNGDTRIFAFILSTRSGGIGVNLTGADTVIFYDSDWNPTMDAQAQDRCHRIGQTRDVHIYRLVSERTIEENILKKANQKRLLGDLAIEGGNFTTAYFKSSTIQDLFNIEANEEKAVLRTSEIPDPNAENQRVSGTASVSTPAPDDKAAIGALENALAACEDDQDVQAARIAKAEAVADLAEFDETIPLEEQDKEKEPEISKAEQEVENLIKQLTPIERYAMRFIEETEAMWSAEQLAAAEREIEEQKLEWERNRLAAMQEEKERRAKEMEEESELLTFSREDATNQVRHKNRKFLRNSDSLPKKFIKRVNTKSSINKSAANSRANKRYSSTRASNRRTKSKSIQIENQNFNEESNDCSKTSLCEDQDSMSNDIVSVGSNSRNENDSDSNESYTSDLEHRKKSNNHVDHNSPRTRSRGTVAINLWTLDVSPILPGVKPVRSNMQTVVGRRLKVDTDVNDSSKPQRKILIDRKRRRHERNKKDGINCVKSETSIKRIKKKNGNKDIKLEENLEASVNSEGEKLENNKLEINDPKGETEKDCKMKVDNEKLLESLTDAIDEIEKNSSKKQIKTSVSVQCNSNPVEVSKTLKIVLTDVIANKQFEKYFNSKDGDIENHSDFDSVNCNYSDNSSSSSVNEIRNNEILDTSKTLEAQNVEETPENVDDVKKSATTNKIRLKSPDTKKVMKRIRFVSKVKKTVDPKNNTLDNWLIKSPKNEVEKKTKLKDSSTNLVEVENTGVSEEGRTKNCNALEMSGETNHLEK